MGVCSSSHKILNQQTKTNTNQSRSNTKEDFSTVKCKFINKLEDNDDSHTELSLFFKSNSTFSKIKSEISKKIQKNMKEFALKVKEKVITYNLLKLSDILTVDDDVLIIYIIKSLDLNHENVFDKNEKVNQNNQQSNSDDNVNSNSKFMSNTSIGVGINKDLLINAFKDISLINLYKNMPDQSAIYFLSKQCEIHENNLKLIYFCKVCGVSICEKCNEDYHSSHNVISKHDLIKEYIKLKSYIIHDKNNEKRKNIDEINEISGKIEELDKEILKIKEILKEINEKKKGIGKLTQSTEYFKSNLELFNTEIEGNINNILNDDIMYCKYYQDCLMFSNQIQTNVDNSRFVNEKNEEIWFLKKEFYGVLQKAVTRMKEVSSEVNELKKRIINSKEKKNSNDIVTVGNNENIVNNNSHSLEEREKEEKEKEKDMKFISISDKSNKGNNNNQVLSYNHHNQETPNFNSTHLKKSINLKMILHTPNASLSRISKINNEARISEKAFMSKQNRGSSKREENFIYKHDFKVSITKYIYSYQIGTSILYIYDIFNKKFLSYNISTLLTSIGLSIFESYHSSVNYNNKLFISGCDLNVLKGKTKKPSFFVIQHVDSESYRLDFNNIENIKIESKEYMINPHSFHCSVGYNGMIFTIGGLNSLRADLYLLVNNSDTQQPQPHPDNDFYIKEPWISLPDLNVNRVWACGVIYNNHLYIFSGEYEKTSQSNEVIERISLDIVNQHIIGLRTDVKWSAFNIKSNNEGIVFLPIYSGVLCNNEEILIIGGRENDENTKRIFKIDFDLLSFSLIENKELPFCDEFDGKEFIKFEFQDIVYFSLFSSCNSQKIYIYNTLEMRFEVQCYKEN